MQDRSPNNHLSLESTIRSLNRRADNISILILRHFRSPFVRSTLLLMSAEHRFGVSRLCLFHRYSADSFVAVHSASKYSRSSATTRVSSVSIHGPIYGLEGLDRSTQGQGRDPDASGSTRRWTLAPAVRRARERRPRCGRTLTRWRARLN